jgi:rhamnosyltransferase subunit B
MSLSNHAPEAPALPMSFPSPKRIVLATFGSFGDLHPFIAVGRGLRARGHQVTLAAAAAYREKVEGEGLALHPLPPDVPGPDEAPEVMRRGMDLRTGTEFIVRQVIMPHLRAQYEALAALLRGADLLVSHPIVYAAPTAAETAGVPWAGVMLQPLGYVSAYDPPVPPTHPSVTFLHRLGPRFNAALIRAGKKRFRCWTEPVDRLRAELGLPPGPHPLFEGQHSPHLNLALFSAALGAPQPDWPARTVLTGFPFYDRLEPGTGMPPALLRFLESGPPPVVFTLGSSAVMAAGDFYAQSLAAVRLLGCRAVLLVGQEGWNRLPEPLPPGVFACDYAPHGDLFPRAAAIVHQCGVGTTGQSMRAGKPVLAVPFSHDQPDNAVRLARRGMARVLPRARYTAARAAGELRRLLEEPRYAEAAAGIGRQVAAEDGVAAACDALEGLLARLD